MRAHTNSLSPLPAWWAATLWLALTVPAEAHAQAVRCLDRTGTTHTLASRPDPAYRFFVRCEPVAEARAREQPEDATRRQAPANVSVPWPAAREPRPTTTWRLAPNGAALAAARAELAATLPARAEAYLPAIHRVAGDYGLDPYYLKAVMHTESAFNRDAISPKGAVGLMQVMPATAERFGVSDPQLLRDPDVNIQTAARYIAYLRRLFDGDWTLITAAYNAGEGAVRRYGNQIPPFAETQNYVRLVDARLQQYSGSGRGQ